MDWSGDMSSLLEIPGAWISKELDLDLSLPTSLTPSSNTPTAYIRTTLDELPPSRDPPLPTPAPIVHSTPRASRCHTGGGPDHGVREEAFPMPVCSIIAVEDTPQSTLSLLSCALDASTPFSSSIGTPPLLLQEPIQTVSGNASVCSCATGVSFDPHGSPLSKYNSDCGFSTIQEDPACVEFASSKSLNSPVIDGSPPLASTNILPSIPPIASDLQLHNFPMLDGQPERNPTYSSATEGDFPAFPRSDDSVEPFHETSSSSGSALDLCIPTAEEAHHQILLQENPAPRRPTVRIVVRNNVLEAHGERATRRESFTYTCESLPYDAGLQPHTYVDNHQRTIQGKHHLQALEEDLCATDEFVAEDPVVGRSKRSTILRRLAEGKMVSKLIAFGPLKSTNPQNRFSVDSKPPAVFSLTAGFAGRNPGTATHPNHSDYSPSLTPFSPPPTYTTSNKKRHHTTFQKSWSGPRSLSIFAVPKTEIKGKPASPPLPNVEPPPPPPQRNDAQSHQTDAHGRSCGPSRIMSLEFSSDLSNVTRRKERMSWLVNARSSKNSRFVG